MVEHATGSHSPEGYSGDDGVRIRDRSERLAARMRRTGPGLDRLDGGCDAEVRPARPVAQTAPDAVSAAVGPGTATGACDAAATGAWDGAATGSATGAWDGAATGSATGAWDGAATGAWDVDGPDGPTVALVRAGASRVGGSALLASHSEDHDGRARSGSVADLLDAPRRPLSFYVAPFGTPPFGNPPGAESPWPGADRAVRARPVWGPPQREV